MYTRPLCCMSLTGLYVDVHACVSIGDHFPCPPAREQVHVQRAVLVRDVGGLDNGNRGRKSIPSVFLLAGCWYVCGLWLVGDGEEDGTWIDSNISGLGERGDGSPSEKRGTSLDVPFFEPQECRSPAMLGEEVQAGPECPWHR